MSRAARWTAGLACLLAAAAPGRAAVSAQEWARYSVITPAGPAEPSPALFHQLKRLVWTVHKVTRKDASAAALAREYGTTVSCLQTTNNDELLLLYPGRRLTVLNYRGSGRLYEVRKDSETLNEIVGHYHRDRVGAFRFKEAVVFANRLPGVALLSDYEFLKGARILLPNVRRRFDGYRFPVDGLIRITSGFGWRFHPLLHRTRMHDGFDIAKPWGTPVFPARSGRVIRTGWAGGYGLLVVIRHPDGYTTRYGHLSKILVHVGQIVQRGRTLIGRVGSTGLSTGPHLHFEVRNPAGRPINPMVKIGRR